jgi:Response regulator containing CheY-like receiver, AAA-type ATPase, and DNA-binding domains
MEDLPLLAQHFLKKFCKDQGKVAYEITPEAFELLMEYPWPGNVRELENTIRTALLFHQKEKIVPKSFTFKKALFGGGSLKSGIVQKVASGRKSQGGGALSDEKRLLLKALHDKGYHKGLAAESLGISRRYLYTQMMRHGVPTQRIAMKSYVEEQLGVK